MNVTMKRCEDCGLAWTGPYRHCSQCAPKDWGDEFRMHREAASDLMVIGSDLYSDGLLCWDGVERTFAIREAGMAIRSIGYQQRETLIKDAQRLTDENRELLIENAKLRRALERKR